MLFLQNRQNADDSVWNLSSYIYLKKWVEPDFLEECLNEIVRQNDALRLHPVFTADGVLLEADPYSHRTFEIHRFETEESFLSWAKETVSRPVFQRPGMWDAFIIEVGEKIGILNVGHHAMSDGLNVAVLYEKLLQCVSGHMPEAHSYLPHLEAEAQYRTTVKYEKDKRFWEDRLRGGFLSEFFRLPEGSTERGCTNRIYELAHGCVEQMEAFCTGHGIPESALIYGAAALTLHYLRQADRFSIGIPVLGRSTQAEMHALGLFMHTVPLIVEITDTDLLSFVQYTEEQMFDLFRHQKFTIYDIKKEIRNLPVSGPLYDVIVDYTVYPASPDYESHVLFGDSLAGAMELHFLKEDGDLKYTLRARDSILRDPAVSRFHSLFTTVLSAILTSSGTKIAEVPLLSAEEREAVLYRFNDTAMPYDKTKSVYDLFLEQAGIPGQTARIRDGASEYTLAQLADDAARIDTFIRNKVGIKKQVIGVLCDRSYAQLAAVYGVVRGGNAYMPISPHFPPERIRAMLDSGKCNLVLAQKQYLHLTEKARSIEEILQEKPPCPAPAPEAKPEDPLYVIYTSGSSGTPKGAVVTNLSAVNRIRWMANRFFDGGSVIMLKTPFTFDVSVWEIFGFAMYGFSLYILPPDAHYDQQKVLEYIEKGCVTDLHFVPTVFDLFLSALGKTEMPQMKLRTVRHIFLSGESVSAGAVNTFRRFHDGHITVHNLYGPAECAVDVTAYDCTETETDPVPIGKPIINTQIYILDQNMEPVPIGITGEICIAGDNVGLGYLNDPERTKASFIANPYGPGLLYMTGDLAYWREDGNIIFAGRNDLQIKLNGQRMEPGEIEAALCRTDGVESAAVVMCKDSEDRQLLCAFYTGHKIPAKELRTALIQILPTYMIPQAFVHLDAIPMTSSGKTDRIELRNKKVIAPEAQAAYVAPQTESEAALVSAAQQALNVERIGMLDNFFDLGGDSLRCILWISLLEEQGYTLTAADVFSAADMAALAEKLRPAEKPTVPPTAYPADLPLTAAQTEIYTAQSVVPDCPLYNIPYFIKVKSPDLKRLQYALDRMLQRHEILRTRFINTEEGPRQTVDETARCILQEIKGDPIDFITPFDLTKAPLMRVGYQNDMLIFDFHHLIADGSSVPVFFRELNEYYMGREPAGTFLPFQSFAATETADPSLPAYWRARFPDGAPRLRLRTDLPRPAIASHAGKTLFRQVPQEIGSQIAALCKAEGITPFVFYFGAFQILLHKFSGQEDITVGIPSGGRTAKNLGTIGMFVQTLPLRCLPEGDKTVGQFFGEVRDLSLAAVQHGGAALSEIAAAAGEQRLFDVMFTYQSEEMTSFPFGDSPAAIIPVSLPYAKYDLEFSVYPRKEGAVLALTFATDLYRDETPKRMMRAYEKILAQALDTDKKLYELTPLRPEEREFLLLKINDTTTPGGEHTDVYDLFLRHVERDPDRPAVTAADGTLSYLELDIQAGRIAKGLQEAGVGPGDIVAVILPRNSKLICSVLGVLKAGAAYLPLDPQQPPERLNYFINDSAAKFCITEESFCAVLAEEPLLHRVPTGEDALCYCIYTSGSTGTPKGVLIRRNNLAAYNYGLCRIYGETPVNMPFFTSACVDLSVTSVYLPLVTGGCIHVYSGDLNETLPQITANSALNILKLTPTHMRIMCELCPQKELKNIKHIIAGGETLYQRDAAMFALHFGRHLKIHNEYGPTETTVGCMDYVYDPSDETDDTPIGKPIANTQIYVVDKYMNPVPVGVTGELCIAGAGVGNGYLNRPALTAKKFVQNPFSEGLLYKTGDLAWVRDDGNLVFAGRNDLQIKLNGYRVEPGEIETALCEANGVKSAAVAVRRNGSDKQVLCAFYTGRKISADKLRAMLLKKLPIYMIPQVFTHLDAMPLTASGKTDRSALPEIRLFEKSEPETDIPPATPTQLALADAVTQTLGLESVSMADNYYSLGGDSIRAIHIASILIGKGYDLAVSDIMQCAALKDTAAKMRPIRNNNSNADEADLLSLPLTPSQEGIWLQTMREPKDPAYRLRFLLEVMQQIETNILRKSFVLLALRHPVLCFAFPSENAAGTLLQTVKPDRTILLEETVYPFAKDESLLKNRIEQAKTIPFDFERDVLFRAEYIVFTDARFLLIRAHHIILDGWSLPVLAQDLFGFAKRLSEGIPFEQITAEIEADLPARTVFQRYAKLLARADKTQAYAHWDHVLNGCVPARLFPDRAAAYAHDAQRASFDTDVPSAVSVAAARLKRQHGISENTIFEGAFALTLRLFSSSGDVMFCKAISGRAVPLEKIEEGVGPFLNTVPVRFAIHSPQQTVEGFLRETQEQSIRANRFGILRLGEILRRSEIAAGAVEILFAYENYYFETDNVPGLSKLPIRLCDTAEQTEFPLAVTLRQTNGRFNYRITYAPGRFSLSDIKRLSNTYLQILQRLTASESVLSAQIDDLSASPSKKKSFYATDKLLLAPETPPNTAPAYVPPVTEAEKLLARAVEKVLRLPEAGMNNNYFALGGDSIRAIFLASEMQDAGWSLRITDIMRADTLRSLAQKMTRLTDTAVPAVAEAAQRFPLPPAARAYLHGNPDLPEQFWQSFIMETNCKEDEIEAALTELAGRHSVLRAVLQDKTMLLPPRDSEQKALLFHAYEVSAEEGGVHEARRRLLSRSVSFDLANGPLSEAVLYTAPDGSLLRLTVHHLVIDLFSWEILLKELQCLLQRHTDASAPSLPEQTADFSQWMQALQQYRSVMPAQERAYWEHCRTEAEGAVPLTSDADPLLPGEAVSLTLDAGLTSALLQLEQNENVRLDALLLAALGRAADRIAGGAVCVCVESLGRPQLPDAVRIDNTVGWFTAISPIVIEDRNNATQLLFDVRRKLQNIPQSGVGWLLLNENLPESADLMFNFYRYRSDASMPVQPVFPAEDGALNTLFPGVISADCGYIDGKITILFRCPQLKRPPKLLKELAGRFSEAITEIADQTNFSAQRADAADMYTDDSLTYGELSELDALFNRMDNDEQN